MTSPASSIGGPPPEVAVLDLSHEVSARRLDVAVDDARAWIGAEVDPEECLVPVGNAAAEEIEAIVRKMREQPLPLLLRSVQDFRVDAVGEVMQAAKRQLDGGLGVAVIDRLSLDGLSLHEMTELFWTLGQLIGRTVAEKWDGSMLYDVRDTGSAFQYGVRGSWTNIELNFHTDNAFGIAPPDYVGLLCVHPAKEGGVSRFCSLYSVHNRMLEQHPRLLERLYEPMLFDRQAEHAEGAPPVAFAPVFRFDGERLIGRANPSLVRKGYAVAGLPVEPLVADALDALEAVADAPDLWLESPIQRGQMQYLNNVGVAHYRSEFRDADDPERKRHLVRTWHRERGARSYDGI